MTLFMLDTSMVSHLIQQHPVVVRHVTSASIASLCISVITAGELLFGLARRPEATRLKLAIQAFLQRVEPRAWDNAAATRYAIIRADLRKQGKTLAPLDLLIAPHAASVDAVLVTNDDSFEYVQGLRVEDWTA